MDQLVTKVFAAAFLMATLFSAALAQQQPQQTPSQLALQMSGIMGQWAQALEALQSQNAELQAKLATVTKERDDLKAKLEEKK